MDQDTHICRLCLKTIKKVDPYSALTNNNAVLQSLNLISFVTIKNLQLTESPVICDLCVNKLKQLASFKENIITNEFQIQCHQKKDLNSFLESISKDFDSICRLCLKASEIASKLKENWRDNKKMFNKCNIHLNLDIKQPSKICTNCYSTLQSMSDFVSECCENEKHIVNLSIKKGKLSNEDLLEISSYSAKNLKRRNSGEDNNNFTQKNEKEKSVSSENALHDGSNLQISSGEGNDSSDKVSSEAKISLDDERNEKEELVFKRTPNTYTRAKSRPRKTQKGSGPSKLNILSDISIKRQAEPSTSKGINNESIDVSPVENVADITLEIDCNGLVEPDSVSPEKDNVTQELINLIEGTEELMTLNEKENVTEQYKDTEELLKILEDDENITVSVVIEEISENSEAKESPSLLKKCENNVHREDIGDAKVQELESLSCSDNELSKISSTPKKSQNIKDLIVTYTFVDAKDLKGKSPIKSEETSSKIKCAQAQVIGKPLISKENSERKKVKVLNAIEGQGKQNTVKAVVETSSKKINNETELKSQSKNNCLVETDTKLKSTHGLEDIKGVENKKIQNKQNSKDKSKENTLKTTVTVETNTKIINASTEGGDQILEINKGVENKKIQNKTYSKKKEKVLNAKAVVESNTKLINTSVEGENQLLNTKKSYERKKIQNKNDLKDKSSPTAEKTVNQISQTKVEGEASSTKTEPCSSTPSGQKKHNLRQKTIVMSFREMLNMKPLKKKDQEKTESSPKDIKENNNSVGDLQSEDVMSDEMKNSETSQIQVKATRKKTNSKEVGGSKTEGQKKEITQRKSKKMVQISILNDLNQISNSTVDETGTQLQNANVDEKEPNKQTNVESQEKVVPKKRVKKAVVEKNTETIATSEEKVVADSSNVQNVIADSQVPDSGVDKKKRKKTTTEGQEKSILEKHSKKLLSESVQSVLSVDASENVGNTAASQLPEASVEGKKRGKRTNVESQEKSVPKRRGKKTTKPTSAKTTNSNVQDVKEGESSTTSTEIGDQLQEASVKGKKRGKRVNVEAQEKVVPQKRAKKSSQKQLLQTKEPNTVSVKSNEKSDVGSSPVEKNFVEAKNTAAESVPVDNNDRTQTNGEVVPSNTNETESEAQDNSDSEDVNRSPDKPFVVTIIRRNKTRNKAQIDKTWQELTGANVGGAASTDTKDTKPVVPKKRKGRPPLPENLKKAKKSPAKYYSCNVCPYKSISQNMLIQHQYIHTVVDNVTQYQCNSCSFRTNNKEILEQHKVTHLNLDLMFKCVFCEYTHKKKPSTMYHTLRHDDKDIANMFYCIVSNQLTEEEYYECFQCDYQNTEESAMPDHVIDHRVEEIKNPIITKFSCKECSYKTKFEDMFKRHQEIHEEQKKSGFAIKKEPKEKSPEEEREVLYSCDKCNYLTHHRRSLANHKGLKHTRREEQAAYPNARPPHRRPLPVLDQILHCHECSYTTMKKPHLARHVLVHRTKENLEMKECPHCPFETKHQRSFKRHMEVRHKVIM